VCSCNLPAGHVKTELLAWAILLGPQALMHLELLQVPLAT